MPYIQSINVNLFNGKFNQIIFFHPNLNILSGINGTGKTKVLQLLKQGINVNIYPNNTQFNQMKVIALSPKRNAEKRAQQSLLSYIRTINFPSKTQELLNKQIRDESYDSYPSFAELFCLKFEKLRSQDFASKTQQEILDEFTREINNEVINFILPNYRLETLWNTNNDSIEIKIYKDDANDYVSLENLSTGEQELLSLAFNIYLLKDDVDIFLVDEPEIHLNWTLERNIFNFLKEFSTKYQKQIVVSTHSRIIFDPQFKENIIYLVWENNQIKVKKEVPKEYKEKIAGEYAVFTLEPVAKKTLFVEDNEHEITVQLLIDVYGKNKDVLEILKLSGGSGALEILYKAIKNNPNLAKNWTNAWFLQDGDNKELKVRENFIKLEKYSIESYYFNFEVLESLLQKKKDELKNIILNSILKNKNKLVGDNKNSLFFASLLEGLKEEYLDEKIFAILDCSQFFDDFVEEIGYKKVDFMKKYIEKAKQLGKIEEIFDKELIDFIKNI